MPTQTRSGGWEESINQERMHLLASSWRLLGLQCMLSHTLSPMPAPESVCKADVSWGHVRLGGRSLRCRLHASRVRELHGTHHLSCPESVTGTPACSASRSGWDTSDLNI